MMRTIFLVASVLACGVMAAQAPQQASRRPTLPAAMANQIESDEKDLDAKLEKDVIKTDWVPGAVRTAQHAFEVRKDNQGPDWWETREAWWRWQRLQRLAAFKSPQREMLKSLAQLEDQVKALMRRRRYEEVLADLTKAKVFTVLLYGRGGPEFAELLLAFAAVNETLGRHRASEELCMQAAEIDLPISPHLYARDLRYLAQIYFAMHHYIIGREIAFSALNQDFYQVGEESNEYATDLLNLAASDSGQGFPDSAMKELTRAVEIFHQLPSPDRATFAVCLSTLGVLHASRGEYEQARAAIEEALKIGSSAALPNASEEEQLGAGAIEATLKQTLGVLQAYEGHFDEAAKTLVAALRMQWTEVALNLPFMTAEEKALLLATGRGSPAANLDIVLSLACAGKLQDNQDALQAALLAKHLAFEADRQENGALLAALPKLPQQARADWQALREAQAEYSSADVERMMAPGILSTSSDGFNNAEKRRILFAKIQTLDRKLRREIPAYATSAQLAAPRAEDVLRALRPGEALMEFVAYDELSFGKRDSSDASRFAALVAIGGRKGIAAIKIANDSEIRNMVSALQKKMSDYAAKVNQMKADNRVPDPATLPGDESDMAGLLAKLRERVWTPLEAELKKGNVRRVYISPDGNLGLVPFEALARRVNNSWKYLAEENIEICYLNSGRDLARLASVREPKRSGLPTAVLVGNPLFSARPIQLAKLLAGSGGAVYAGGKTGTQTARSTAGSPRMDRDLEQEQQFSDLIAAAKSALHNWQIKSVWTNEQATEENVLRVEAPTLLQFATHGSFLDAEPAGSICDGTPEDPMTLTCDETAPASPMTRSMLFLAGVNRWRPGQSQFYWDGKTAVPLDEVDRGISQSQIAAHTLHVGDGILTAYKVTGMNLLGTELVNLTACDTAVGDITPNGIAGLRQAFFLAGARSVTMSLWQAPLDEVVKGEMGDFYNLWPQRTAAVPVISRFEAFHRAQLKALAQTRKNYGCGIPFYWAATIYVGDPGDLPEVASESH